MREKNRNSIASCLKFPQFTTMNVIDGQAGLVIYASLIFYSLTIDNILNIIVLLILAGISISMLAGDNSILQKSTDAKIASEKAEAKEQAQMDIMAYIADKTANHEDTSLDDEKVKGILTGKSYVKTANDTSFITAKGEYVRPYSELYQASNVTPSDPVTTNYEVGNTIKIGNEEFYIIENNENSLKLFSKQIVNPSNLVFYANRSPATYESSNVKTIVETYVNSLEVEVQESGILTKNNVETLAEIDSSIVYTDEDWSNAYFLKNTESEYSTYYVFEDSISTTYTNTDADEGPLGVRPYIVVLKSDL